jgi:predicted esterase
MRQRGDADGGRGSSIRLGRRRLLGVGGAGIAALMAAGIGDGALARFGSGPLARKAMASGQDDRRDRQVGYQRGRLSVRPASPTDSGPTGLLPLGLGGERDGLLYVPESYQADRPASLVLMLHGAGGSAQNGLRPLMPLANEAGLLLLAVDSRQKSWDVIFGEYGSDVAFIDRALAYTFARYAVDPTRIAAEGFSDGASYALSIGITNGDLFTHVLAFSPGFNWPGDEQGKPRLFVSHGTADDVLPIDQCSRRIVPKVRRAGYDVRYREFEGGHTVPPEIAQEAVTWLTEA